MQGGAKKETAMEEKTPRFNENRLMFRERPYVQVVAPECFDKHCSNCLKEVEKVSDLFQDRLRAGRSNGKRRTYMRTCLFFLEFLFSNTAVSEVPEMQENLLLLRKMSEN